MSQTTATLKANQPTSGGYYLSAVSIHYIKKVKTNSDIAVKYIISGQVHVLMLYQWTGVIKME